MNVCSSRCHASLRVLGAMAALMTVLAAIGCGSKEDKPNAPGYYDGKMTTATKMQGKSAAKTGQ